MSDLGAIDVGSLGKFFGALDGQSKASQAQNAEAGLEIAKMTQMGPARIKQVKEAQKLDQLVRQRSADLHKDIFKRLDFIPTGDFYAQAAEIGNFLSETTPMGHDNPLDQDGQAYLNSTDAVRNLREGLGKLMDTPTIQIKAFDERGENILDENDEVGRPNPKVTKYARPISYSRVLASSGQDINIARTAMLNTPNSKKQERATELGGLGENEKPNYVWMKGQDPEFGFKARLMGPEESMKWHAREAHLESIMKRQQVSRQTALDSFYAHQDSVDRLNEQSKRIQQEHGVSEAVSHEMILDKDREIRRQERHSTAMRATERRIRALPESLQKNEGFVNATFAAEYGADSPQVRALELFRDKQFQTMTDRQAELMEVQEAQTANAVLFAKDAAGLETEITPTLEPQSSEILATLADIQDQVKVNRLGIPALPANEQLAMQKHSDRLESIMTLASYVDPRNQQKVFIEKTPKLARAMSDKKSNQLLHVEGFFGANIINALVSDPLPGFTPKKAKDYFEDLEAAFLEFNKLVEKGDLSPTLTGIPGDMERWQGALLRITSQAVQRTSGTKWSDKIYAQLIALKSHLGVKSDSINSGDALERRLAKIKETNDLNERERKLKAQGATTPVDRLRRGRKRTSAELQHDSTLIRAGASVMDTNPDVGATLIERGGVPLPHNDPAAFTSPQVPVNTITQGTEPRFDTNEEFEKAFRSGELRGHKFVWIDNKRWQM